MRKIDANNFQVATRGTTREINCNIALNLIRERQPISRAGLSVLMGVQRSAVSLFVNTLIEEKLIYEGGDGETSTRGRKPTLLYVNTEDRFVIAVDVRFTGTYVMLSDFSGRQLALETFATIFDPKQLVRKLAQRIKAMLKTHGAASRCEGIGIAAPGMVNHHTGRILHAPMMNWRNVDVRDQLAQLTNLPVIIESAPKPAPFHKSGSEAATATALRPVIIRATLFT
ncbi:MAG: ROK family protein [Pyrinomonadaceae bacterium]